MEKIYFYCYGCYVGRHEDCLKIPACDCFASHFEWQNIEDCLFYTE